MISFRIFARDHNATRLWWDKILAKLVLQIAADVVDVRAVSTATGNGIHILLLHRTLFCQSLIA